MIELNTKLFSRLLKGIPLDWNKELGIIITDEKIKIPLPKGFKNTKITNKINEGIVIEDIDGNQFVWVSTINVKFERSSYGRLYSLDSINDSKEEKDKILYFSDDDIPAMGSYWEDKNDSQYIKIMKSQKKYKGFYIGRYEASYASGSDIEDYKPGSKKTISNSLNSMKHEKGTLWNYISQEDAMVIASNMYKDNVTIVSHIPFAAEWDTTLLWLVETKAKTMDEISKDSSQWGNTGRDKFTKTFGLIDTGSFEETKANNIYDLSGNLLEWTQENYGDRDNAVARGGYWYGYLKTDSTPTPASCRINRYKKDLAVRSIGFRVALYIK